MKRYSLIIIKILFSFTMILIANGYAGEKDKVQSSKIFKSMGEGVKEDYVRRNSQPFIKGKYSDKRDLLIGNKTQRQELKDLNRGPQSVLPSGPNPIIDPFPKNTNIKTPTIVPNW